MADYLQLGEGKVTVAVLSDVGRKGGYHWDGQRNRVCKGPGCPFCASGRDLRERWDIDVTVEGKPWTVTVPKIAYDQLWKVTGAQSSVRGFVLELEARGNGAGRRYGWKLVGKGGELPSPPALQSPPAEEQVTTIHGLPSSLDYVKAVEFYQESGLKDMGRSEQLAVIAYVIGKLADPQSMKEGE